MTSLRVGLATPPLIVDGGLATELEADGHDLAGPLWSARLLLDAPAAIVAVHRRYLAAGADVLITASYQASPDALRAHGLSPADVDRVFAASTALAREAIALEGRPARVAASVGPYGAARADGSEFTGAYDKDEAALHAWHRPRLERLLATGPDLLACETIPSVAEARALARALTELGSPPAWLALACRDERHLCDGTPIERVPGQLAGAPFAAIGVNCTAPRHVAGLLAALAGATPLPLVAYPNAGERWDAGTRRWSGPRDPAALAELAPTWVARGARLVGGCCRTTPAHIHALRAAIRR